MLSTTAVRTAMAVLGLMSVQASSAAAQGTPNQSGYIQLSAYFEVTNAYLFRGLLQDDTGWIMQPAADARVRLSDATGPVVHVGTWNTLTTGLAGSDGPTHRLWYESDFYATFSVPLTNDYAASAAYTAPTRSLPLPRIRRLMIRPSRSASPTWEDRSLPSRRERRPVSLAW